MSSYTCALAAYRPLLYMRARQPSAVVARRRTLKGDERRYNERNGHHTSGLTGRGGRCRTYALGQPASKTVNSMATDVEIRCSCGKFSGLARGIAAGRGHHGVCYCDDCQLFQHYLGKADDVLDDHGGTQIFQMSSARFAIAQGEERLACLRLRPGGLCRWYASCCNSPLGNTMDKPGLPFVGVITACMHAPMLDVVLGPLKFRVHGRFALGDARSLGADDRASLRTVLRTVAKLARWRLAGGHKRSPFFAVDGALRVTPNVLSRDELRSLESAREAWSPRP